MDFELCYTPHDVINTIPGSRFSDGYMSTLIIPEDQYSSKSATNFQQCGDERVVGIALKHIFPTKRVITVCRVNGNVIVNACGDAEFDMEKVNLSSRHMDRFNNKKTDSVTIFIEDDMVDYCIVFEKGNPSQIFAMDDNMQVVTKRSWSSWFCILSFVLLLIVVVIVTLLYSSSPWKETIDKHAKKMMFVDDLLAP